MFKVGIVITLNNVIYNKHNRHAINNYPARIP